MQVTRVLHQFQHPALSHPLHHFCPPNCSGTPSKKKKDGGYHKLYGTQSFISIGSKTLGSLLNCDWLVSNYLVIQEFFHPIILIYRRSKYALQHWGCTPIYLLKSKDMLILCTLYIHPQTPIPY